MCAALLMSVLVLPGIASDGLKGRVYEVSLADLQQDQDAERSFRKFKLICEEVQGKNCLTNFHGMDITTDKLRSMVKKWQVGSGRLAEWLMSVECCNLPCSLKHVTSCHF